MTSRSEINDKFKNAMNVVADILNNIKTPIDCEKYDGLIVKKLKSSNTLDPNRTTNQTHIAITGKQMEIFPYLRSDEYFNSESTDETLKDLFLG